MGFDLSPEDLKVFLEEAEEQLQSLEDGFMELERSGAEDTLLQTIFRAAHTLKGSSATLGHQRMAEFTHHMENVLDRLRKRTLDVSGDLADLLLECLDALRLFKDEIATGAPAAVDVAVLIERLDRFADGHGGPGAAAGPGRPWPAAAEGGGAAGATGRGPSWQVDQRCRESLESGQPVFSVRARIDPQSPMPSVRAFQILYALAEHGEVLWSDPSQAEIEDERVGEDFTALCVCSADAESVVRALADVSDVSAIAVEPYKGGSVADSGLASEGAAAAAAAPAAPAVPASGGGVQGRNGQGLRGGRTVRVDVEVLDNLMNLVGELVIDRGRLTAIVSQLGEKVAGETAEELSRTSFHIGRVATDLQEEIMRARMIPVDNLFKKFPRMVRDLAASFGKEVDFAVRGEETELDRSVIEEIGDPLMHLIRNSVDHGIEAPAVRRAAGKRERGTLLLEASHEENAIVITVKDDGKGIDPAFIREKAIQRDLITEEAARRMDDRQIIDLIFAAGFSTQDQISEVSGRGVGMDVVRSNIDRLKGSIEIRTTIGKGTEFRIKLPLTLAIIRALLVDVRRQVFAIPLTSVTETIHVRPDDVQTIRTEEVILVRGHVLPLIRLSEVFGIGEERGEAQFPVVVVAVGSRQYGLVVDELIGEQEIVVKSLGKFVGDIAGISGATIIGDGSVALILEVPALCEPSPGVAR